MHRVPILFFVALLLVPNGAWAQGEPVGPEFRVNTYTTNTQLYPFVAADAAGNFVVVWESNYGGQYSYWGVFAQRFASSGAPVGPEFRVNTYTTGNQYRPSVASDSSGNFVVVWDSPQDGWSYGIFGQRYASTGVPLGAEFRVNTYTTDYQIVPSVASDASGNFVVVWSSYVPGGSGDAMFGQRYASTGVPLGPEFRVNTYMTDYQFVSSVASDASGNFVVVWSSWLQDGSEYGVFCQRYANTGIALGPEFRVNTYTTSSQRLPAVASDSSGNFVVVWESQDGSDGGIFGQRYSQIVPVELMDFRVE